MGRAKAASFAELSDEGTYILKLPPILPLCRESARNLHSRSGVSGCTSPAFKDGELASIHETMRSARVANFVTLTASGLICMRLRLFLVETEGEHGVLYGHLAKAKPPVEGSAEL